MTDDQHLSNEEIAQCADALNNGTYTNLPVTLRTHLETCTSCASEIMMVSELAQEVELKTSPITFASPLKAKTKIIKLRYKILLTTSVAASTLLFIVYLHNYYEKKNQKTAQNNNTEVIHIEKDSVFTDTSTTKDSFVKDNKTAILLASYVPDDNLEKLYYNNRNAYRSSSIIIDLPDTVLYEPGARLQWKNPKSETLTIAFFNNLGKQTAVMVSSDNNIKLPSLTDGLYYYKLFNNDYDLLFIGKIIADRQK